MVETTGRASATTLTAAATGVVTGVVKMVKLWEKTVVITSTASKK